MEIISTVAIALFTALLVWATLKLAKHTLALTEATKSLVKIEEKRDQLDLLRNRHFDLKKAIEAAETIQKLSGKIFASTLTRTDKFPEKEILAIEALYSFRRYIDDEDLKKCLFDLCNIFDEARKDIADYKPNVATIDQDIKDIQRIVFGLLKKWREELGSAG
jgi:hypothetical protein